MRKFLFICNLTLFSAVYASGLLDGGDSYAISADASGANACYNMAMMEDPRLSLDLEFLLRKSRVGRELGDEELSRAILIRAQNLAASGRDIGQTSYLLGLDAFFVADYSAAQAFFAEALLFHPDPPMELLYYLGWSLYKQGNYTAARNAFLNLQDLNQGEFSPYELNTLLAASEYNDARFHAAKLRVKDAASYPPLSWFRNEALYIAGSAAFRLDSLDQADSFFCQLSDSTCKLTSLARLRMEEGDFRQAELLYSQADTESAQYARSVAAYLDGRHRDAEEAAKDYLALYPDGWFLSETYLLLALIERDRGRHNSSLAWFKQGMEADSTPHPELIRNMAQTQFSYRKYTEACKTARLLLSQYPEYPGKEGIQLLEARCLFYLGESDSAQIKLNKLLMQTQDVVIINQSHYYLGEVAVRKGDYYLAIKEFVQVTEGSLLPRALKKKGQALAKTGQHAEAIKAFRQALALTESGAEKEDIELYIEESKLAQGTYPDRISMLKKYIELYPEASHNPALQLEIALEYFEQRNCVACLHEINKLLDRYPDSEASAEGLQYKARCQRRLGRTEEAIATYREIPRSFPLSKVTIRSQVELAELLLILGRDTEALLVYRDLVKNSRSAADRALFTLSMSSIYHSQGNNQTAADLLENALDESSSASVAKKGFLLGVEVELARGDIRAARKYASRYLNRFGETAEYSLYKGAIELTSGKLNEALTAYRHASTGFSHRSESRIEALMGAAEAARLLGKHAEARNFLEQAALEVQIDRQRIEITRRLQALD